MNLNPVKVNVTELSIGKDTILFSYATPVVLRRYCLKDGRYEFYRTAEKFSATTTRHINTWLRAWVGNTDVPLRPQEFFDNLVQ